MAPLPLLGDENGVYRVKIVGNCGTGKSTLGIALATLLNIPYISLDEEGFQPGWVSTPRNELRVKLHQAMTGNGGEKGWVLDGNYEYKGIADKAATDIIWLDPPLFLYFPRLLRRTVLRLLHLRPPLKPGCPESFREVFFSRRSILWWCLKNHWTYRRRGKKKMEKMRIWAGYGPVKMKRIGGWGEELRRWWRDVHTLVNQRDQRRDVL